MNIFLYIKPIACLGQIEVFKRNARGCIPRTTDNKKAAKAVKLQQLFLRIRPKEHLLGYLTGFCLGIRDGCLQVIYALEIISQPNTLTLCKVVHQNPTKILL